MHGGPRADSTPQLVILDLAMPKMTGGDLLNDVHHVVAEVVLCFRNVCFRRCTSRKSSIFL
jgi:DNA-binding NarL/FixJ family response regulator